MEKKKEPYLAPTVRIVRLAPEQVLTESGAGNVRPGVPLPFDYFD